MVLFLLEKVGAELFAGNACDALDFDDAFGWNAVFSPSSECRTVHAQAVRCDRSRSSCIDRGWCLGCFHEWENCALRNSRQA
jgi:hypothetical protein